MTPWKIEYLSGDQWVASRAIPPINFYDMVRILMRREKWGRESGLSYRDDVIGQPVPRPGRAGHLKGIPFDPLAP